MGKFAYFDAENNVVATDFSGLVVTPELLSQIVQETIEVGKGLPQPVYVISCWHTTKMEPEMVAYFGEQCQVLLQHFRGLVRYGVADPITNITIRSATLMTHLQGNNSYIYKTKEEALAAVRQREKQDALHKNKQ